MTRPPGATVTHSRTAASGSSHWRVGLDALLTRWFPSFAIETIQARSAQREWLALLEAELARRVAQAEWDAGQKERDWERLWGELAAMG